jgi:hypothetical protein
MNNISSLIHDAADFCSNTARYYRYRVGHSAYAEIVREAKVKFGARARSLGLTCDSEKEHGTKPDQFGSLLGKELAIRKAIKQLAKKDPYYADPMPSQPNKVHKPLESQLELFHRKWIA